MALGTEPAGDSGDRLTRDDDAGILGQRSRHEGPDEIRQDRRALPVIGKDPDTDLAVLKVTDAQGRSADISGTWVCA